MANEELKKKELKEVRDKLKEYTDKELEIIKFEKEKSGLTNEI